AGAGASLPGDSPDFAPPTLPGDSPDFAPPAPFADSPDFAAGLPGASPPRGSAPVSGALASTGIGSADSSGPVIGAADSTDRDPPGRRDRAVPDAPSSPAWCAAAEPASLR